MNILAMGPFQGTIQRNDTDNSSTFKTNLVDLKNKKHSVRKG